MEGFNQLFVFDRVREGFRIPILIHSATKFTAEIVDLFQIPEGKVETDFTGRKNVKDGVIGEEFTES